MKRIASIINTGIAGWIDDRDVDSKSMFNFPMILFSFTERGRNEPEAPVITVPAN
jgi:hypothetical protein